MNTGTIPDEVSDIGWGGEQFRAPTVEEGETALFSEPGRAFNKPGSTGVCYRSHFLMLVKGKYGGYTIRVKHGGGEEVIRLGTRAKGLVAALDALPSDARYTILFSMYDAAKSERSNAESTTRMAYEQAFLDGSLKKKRKGGTVRVVIEKPGVIG